MPTKYNDYARPNLKRGSTETIFGYDIRRKIHSVLLKNKSASIKGG